MLQALPFFSPAETSGISRFTLSRFSRLTLLSLGPFSRYSLVITSGTEHDTRRHAQLRSCSSLP